MHQYYVYEHWRKDKNECFYVGIGKILKLSKVYGFNTKYSRAFEKTKRSDYWKNIVAKTDYSVKIVFESFNKKEIEEKEIELIAFYGRSAYDSSGILVNFSKGGDLNDFPKRRDIRISQIDKNTKKVIKIWDQPKCIEEKLGYLKTNIVKCCRKKQLTAYGFIWKYTDNKNFEHIIPTCARKKNSNRGVGINVIDKNNNTMLFRTIAEVAKYYNLHISTISKYLSKKTKHKFLDFSYRKWTESRLKNKEDEV